jgi:hypothetical protein
MKKLIIKALKHGMSFGKLAKATGMKKPTLYVMVQKDNELKHAYNEYRASIDNIARDIVELSSVEKYL